MEFDSGQRGHMDVGGAMALFADTPIDMAVNIPSSRRNGFLGNEGRTEAGDVQVMSAGAGIRHAEYNLADARCGLRAILPAGPVTRCDGQHSGLVRRWR